MQTREATHAIAIDSDSEGFLLTTGKDGLIKLWDLSSRHSIETHVRTDERRVPGHLEFPRLKRLHNGRATMESSKFGHWPPATWHRRRGRSTWLQRNSSCKLAGHCSGMATKRLPRSCFTPDRDYFAVHGAEKAVEIWRTRTEAEIKKSLARKTEAATREACRC